MHTPYNHDTEKSGDSVKRKKPKIPQLPPAAQRAFNEWARQLPPQLRAAARHCLRVRPPCRLCLGPFGGVAVFIPHSPERWGAPPGFRTGIAYGLCEACMALPDWQARVEAVLWQELQ